MAVFTGRLGTPDSQPGQILLAGLPSVPLGWMGTVIVVPVQRLAKPAVAWMGAQFGGTVEYLPLGWTETSATVPAQFFRRPSVAWMFVSQTYQPPPRSEGEYSSILCLEGLFTPIFVGVTIPCPYIPERQDESELAKDARPDGSESQRGRADEAQDARGRADEAQSQRGRADESQGQRGRADETASFRVKADESAALRSKPDEAAGQRGRADESSGGRNRPDESQGQRGRADPGADADRARPDDTCGA